MSRTTTISHGSDSGFTLDELVAFVQECMRVGATGSEQPTVRITWGGKAKSLSLDVRPESS